MFTVYCMNEKCISKKQVLNIIYYVCFYYMCHACLFIQINIIECFYFINYLAIISKTAQVYKEFHNLFSWATSQIHRLPFTVFKKNCTILQISKIVFSKDNMVINIFHLKVKSTLFGVLDCRWQKLWTTLLSVIIYVYFTYEQVIAITIVINVDLFIQGTKRKTSGIGDVDICICLQVPQVLNWDGSIPYIYGFSFMDIESFNPKKCHRGYIWSCKE